MTATAKVISIGDARAARDARRRSVSANQRASLSFKAKQPVKISAEEPEEVSAKAAAKAERAAAKAAKANTRGSVKASMRASKPAKHAAKAPADTFEAVETLEAPVSKASAYAAAFAAPSATSGASATATAASSQTAVRAATRASASTSRAARATKDDPALAERARALRESAREHRAAKRFVLRNKVNNILSRPFATGVLVFCGLMLIMGIFLYPTARTYYHAVREHARLETEFLLVLERNEQLAEDIEFLQTDEGITREAREQLGWVERGEHAVIVYGSQSTPEADVNADIVSASVKAPTTWYSPFLDFFFGYK